jgi:hypothetical protein
MLRGRRSFHLHPYEYTTAALETVFSSPGFIHEDDEKKPTKN